MSRDKSMRENIITERLLEVFPEAEKIVLFGSRATGDDVVDSDYDLVVVVETSLPFVERGVRARLALRGIDAAFDILVVTPEELKRSEEFQSGVISNAMRSGEVLHAAS